ncbi:hypothetical protein EAO70_12970 [Streptomyces sp. adm13(2018)]|uniref:hypothetical protein n=1 Tax=Streptomyces sp. adm13(2018) TaxID=2479007 RepID=UPI0011CE02F6|nr:hypothetical protein [Streptomyces sp. adm13(2018)]TXS16344.1 hypothetical protein EAO70_12970 [Streptomyces sp. adm13(2018)]
MPLTPIPIGTTPWGALLNGQIQDLDGRTIALEAANATRPADSSLKAWTFDPATNLVAQVLTTGLLEMVKLPIRTATTITNIVAAISTAGSGLTASQNWAGLYSSAGTLLSQTADQTTAWASTGVKVMPLAAPQVVAAGTYYVAFVSNGTTPPQMPRGSSLGIGADLLNLGLTAATARYATAGTVTALPASVTMASRTTAGRAWWVAVS